MSTCKPVGFRITKEFDRLTMPKTLPGTGIQSPTCETLTFFWFVFLDLFEMVYSQYSSKMVGNFSRGREFQPRVILETPPPVHL